MSASYQISLEFTPNPNTLKFVVNHSFLEKGAFNFLTPESAAGAPLAKKLLEVPGVEGVMIGTNFVTITKALTGEWDIVAEKVPLTIEEQLKSGEPVFTADFFKALEEKKQSQGSTSEIEAKIREILDTDIRPAVAMDGGDITFDRFENGVVYLHLQGSCSSCPSSVATLKMGVETRLKDAIPEVVEVVQV